MDDALDLCQEEQLQEGGPFVRALSKTELKNMFEYRWPGEAWQLNQDASTHALHSHPQYMHAMIKNCGIISLWYFTVTLDPYHLFWVYWVS